MQQKARRDQEDRAGLKDFADAAYEAAEKFFSACVQLITFQIAFR